MQWTKLLTSQRYAHAELSAQERGRSHFHKDHDRIVFSSAFRRLSRKTQVHPMALNDHVHNRLTHSIEVGSVGRSLGIAIGDLLAGELPEGISSHDIGAIVQAACLAHDIGNPPFGHAGEYAIRDWFAQQKDSKLLASLSAKEYLDLATFEGNAQGFRVVTQIENNFMDGGLRLSFPTLGALLKYPWTVEHATAKGKFHVFQTEYDFFQDIAQSLGLIELEQGKYCRHPLVYLMEAADDICYAIVDLEDAIELDILSFEEIQPILTELCGLSHFDASIFSNDISARRKISALRGKAMEHMLDSVVRAFEKNYPAIMAGEYQGELVLDGHPMVGNGITKAKLLAKEKVFPDLRKMELEAGCYVVLGSLLEHLCTAVYQNYQQQGQDLDSRTLELLNLMGSHAPAANLPLYKAYMQVLDFIAAMTDNYASKLSSELNAVMA